MVGSVSGPITTFFREDHDRLDRLLREALPSPGVLDPVPYAAFRAGILRHIAWEEKILLKAAREARGGEPLPIARRLRIDHGAIALLLAPTPTPAIVQELRSILEPHNQVEEGPGGLYDTCEALLADRAEAILEKVRSAQDALAMSGRQFDRKERH